MSTTHPSPGGGTLATWVRDLGLGIRFAVTGGREGWTRTLLTAVGVGLGVAMLLLAAAVPAMMGARNDRGYDRDYSWFNEPPKRTASTVLFAPADTSFRDDSIRGLLLKADGDRPVLPPGVEAMPASGEMVVSPALKKLLDQPGSKLLRERLDYRPAGVIGDQGLLGPAELAYYAGSDKLVARSQDGSTGNATRIPHFGRGESKPEPLGGVLTMLVIIIVVVLLMPVAVFIGTAVRFGGERRDRRLAALRLVGADSRTTRRIAAGEALFGSLLGLVVGTGIFLITRQFSTEVTLYDISVFPYDITPGPGLAALVALAVPGAAVAVTLLAMRGIAVEPLGVVRKATAQKRRLWWRLLIPLAGLGLLAPLFGTVSQEDAGVNPYQVTAGVVLLLVGLTTVLPWLVESVVGRFRGGPLPWQLATRRVQLDSSAAARMVSGVTVAVAGAIALQSLFTGVQSDFVTATGDDPDRAQLSVSQSVDSGAQAQRVEKAFADTPGIRDVLGVIQDDAVQGNASTLKSEDITYATLVVGDCATLRELARVGAGCADGDVFLVQDPGGYGDMSFAKPGDTLDLNTPVTDKYTGTPQPWRIPADARTARSRVSPDGEQTWGVLATPAALDVAALPSPSVRLMLRTDPGSPDAVEHARNTAARIDPTLTVFELTATHESRKFTTIRRGLFIGATATLALIGASLLVSMLEQLRERRKLLAVLVAFGTRRSVLGLSVLWQTALPVALGLALAIVGGAGLGAVLRTMVGESPHVDWASVGVMTGAGAGVVVLVTLLSLPPLWRMMRPDGLRTE
ncbi:FtsX-like permease family protein [Actinacidiphila glaucinigra]|uniref:FtsX-like permease family protein n=1 Tax=Actinacidiphila glaucinigra TaxID=235986 RepID=A0A239EZ01_9ACTN|nr:ABC transporter permease [Actinacidiphila glaucinigra]SNS49691.1 FtsX-like permease family protein [Actinacidiphila glaucinigra]